MSSSPTSQILPGLIILHGNQMEQLRAAVFDWQRSYPLAPLEPAIFLVQSNGVAEWLKIAIAEEMGICAATRIELPGRFLWSAYRDMLGREQVPGRSELDKQPLAWRLMRLLPGLLDQSAFEPLRHFLADGDPERRLQLATRLADLFDQYQVYRADWLGDWAGGRDQLRRAQGDTLPLPEDQRWQAQLWRAVLADVDVNADFRADSSADTVAIPGTEALAQSVSAHSRGRGRVDIHQQFIEAIEAGAESAGRLPRRVVLFGISALPRQTLEALAALSAHTQVLVAVPNPCQFYWGDIIDGRDLLKAAQKRQQSRTSLDLATVAPEELHAHSHPLLAGWGRQGRDFVRLLDEFDNPEGTLARHAGLRIDLFTETQGETLLQQTQAAIRDLLPLAEHPGFHDSEDRSIEFHVAHSAQREVEVLHDRLLGMLGGGEGKPLRPRDIVVMVPDIETFSAAIRAVFGQYGRHDARHIPFEIGDIKDRSVNPLLLALEWLLRLPQQRCRQSEVRDLLDVPALARRFGLADADLVQLGAWIEGAGVRWGLDLAHRRGLGLARTGEQNAWIFGLRRMLLGYASGGGEAYDGIEPYAEVGGLDAALAGSLAQLVESLVRWSAVLAEPATVEVWGQRARCLLLDFFDGDDAQDRLTLARLEESLQCWLEASAGARFTEPVPLAVMREAWLGDIDEPALNHRFVSGGVTFCTLMPMRALPFQVVCLLGMNDGDYPRRAQQMDFDLLARPGMARPGDRSRRDDDRYLMLEALLSARAKLYVSWAGRNVRDNSEEPPSVLVSQLRDYLQAGFACDLAAMTTEHPLQPFGRRYFERGGLVTYAREWRIAHGAAQLGGAASSERTGELPAPAAMLPLPRFELQAEQMLKLRELARFVKQPVRYFFRQRLGVVFSEIGLAFEDDEPFGPDALQEYHLAESLLDDDGVAEAIAAVPAALQRRAERLGREGLLPIGMMGRHWQERLVSTLVPVRTAWLQLCRRFPVPAPKLTVLAEHAGARLEDWLDGMR
ncbi:MAG: exodeoxyribonuclease V subunit gamma, partial [Janthinobacterium lividum]